MSSYISEYLMHLAHWSLFGLVLIILTISVVSASDDETFMSRISDASKTLESDIYAYGAAGDNRNIVELGRAADKLVVDAKTYNSSLNSLNVSSDYQHLQKTYLEMLDHLKSSGQYGHRATDLYNDGLIKVATSQIQSSTSELNTAKVMLTECNTLMKKLSS